MVVALDVITNMYRNKRNALTVREQDCMAGLGIVPPVKEQDQSQNNHGDNKMARKVTLKVEMEVTVNIDDGVDMDELELGMYSDNTAVDIVDCEATKVEAIDSKQEN